MVHFVIGGKIHQGWECSYSKQLTQRATLCTSTVHCGNVHFILMNFVELIPSRGELSTMRAPRREKVDKPGFLPNHLLGVFIYNKAVEVVGNEACHSLRNFIGGSISFREWFCGRHRANERICEGAIFDH